MTDSDTISRAAERMTQAAVRLGKMSQELANARTVREFTSDRMKRAFSVLVAEQLKASHSATAAEHYARATDAWGAQLNDLSEQYRSAQRVIEEHAALVIVYEASRSVLKFGKGEDEIMSEYPHEYQFRFPNCKCTSGPVMLRDCPIHGRLVRSTEAREQAAGVDYAKAFGPNDECLQIAGTAFNVNISAQLVADIINRQIDAARGVQPSAIKLDMDAPPVEVPLKQPPIEVDMNVVRAFAPKQESAPAAEESRLAKLHQECAHALYERDWSIIEDALDRFDPSPAQPLGERLTDSATSSHAIRVGPKAEFMEEIANEIVDNLDRNHLLIRFSLLRPYEETKRLVKVAVLRAFSSDDSQATGRQTKGT